MKILLVEDDEADAMLFQAYLKAEHDFTVSLERSLGDAVERCAHETFDLVVLDLWLPDSSGLDTLNRFREEVESAPGIVLLTGLDDREMALKAVQAGAQDFVVKGTLSSSNLVPAIRHSLERHRMSQELMAANDRVRYLATHCSLTELPNRYLLMDRLENAIASAARSGTGLAVLFIDLDRFKPINDTYGHEAGDLVLRTVGERLKHATRSSDTVARLGGDEFSVLLRGTADPVTIERVAEKIGREVSQPISIDGREVVTRPSIGIALYPTDGETGEALLRNSDAAMYHAKKHHEPHRIWSDSLRVGARDRIQFEADLSRAIEQEEIALNFQPQVDGRSGRIVGFEALARWDRKGFGSISPAEFIPFAEECGLIEELGACVLRGAVRAQAKWLRLGLANGRVAVNVSPRQLRSSSFVSVVREILDSVGLSGEQLSLEITESCLIDDPEAAIEALETLRADGITIEVDDFGTGYSSLGLLAELPLDCLKIDRQFVQGAPADVRRAATTRAIINLALDLGFELMAEGVETAEQRDFLLENGCERMQGFFYSRPVTEDGALALLRSGLISGTDAT